MTDLTLKLLTNILNTARIGVPINGETFGCYVSSTRSGAYAARKDTRMGEVIEIVRPTIPELAAAMEEKGWLK